MDFRQKIVFSISSTPGAALCAGAEFYFHRTGFGLQVYRGKGLKLTMQKDKLFSMNNFKTDAVFSKRLKEDEGQENLTKKGIV